MITFTKTPDEDNRFDHETITISTDTVDRSEIIEAFISFMRASGFHMDDIQEAIDNYVPDEWKGLEKEPESVERLNEHYQKYWEDDTCGFCVSPCNNEHCVTKSK